MDRGSLGPDYRRGLVLGLTLAEIFLLLLFLLLLLFSYLLARSEERWEAVRPMFEAAGLPSETLPELQTSAASVSAALEEYETIVGAESSERAAAETARRLSELRESLSEIGMSIDDSDEIVTRLVEASETQILQEEYELVCGRVDEVRDLIERYHSSESSAEDVLRVCAPTRDMSDFNSDEPQTLAEAGATIRRLRGQNQVISEQLEEYVAGNGLVFPPCWSRPDQPNRAVYSYNIHVHDEGLLVTQGDDRTGQDLSALTRNGAEPPFNQVIPANQFFNQTTGMFDWSVEQRCRFFVRVWDDTSETNKIGWQTSLGLIEGHFYKYVVNAP